MKKALISLVAGAVALGAAVMPASAAPTSIWKKLDGTVTGQLVLIAGMSGMLNDCKSNNSPKYTMFAPLDAVFEGYDDPASNDDDFAGLLEILGTSVAGLSKAPSVVAGILNDHIVNGLFSPDALDANNSTGTGDQSIKKIPARSGYMLSIVNDDYDYEEIYVDGNLVNISDSFQVAVGGGESCNGWLYFFAGFIDSSSNASHEGLNVKDSPNDGTPGGTETQSLPDTL